MDNPSASRTGQEDIFSPLETRVRERIASGDPSILFPGRRDLLRESIQDSSEGKKLVASDSEVDDDKVEEGGEKVEDDVRVDDDDFPFDEEQRGGEDDGHGSEAEEEDDLDLVAAEAARRTKRRLDSFYNNLGGPGEDEDADPYNLDQGLSQMSSDVSPNIEPLQSPLNSNVLPDSELPVPPLEMGNEAVNDTLVDLDQFSPDRTRIELPAPMSSDLDEDNLHQMSKVLVDLGQTPEVPLKSSAGSIVDLTTGMENPAASVIGEDAPASEMGKGEERLKSSSVAPTEIDTSATPRCRVSMAETLLRGREKGTAESGAKLGKAAKAMAKIREMRNISKSVSPLKKSGHLQAVAQAHSLLYPGMMFPSISTNPIDQQIPPTTDVNQESLGKTQGPSVGDSSEKSKLLDLTS